MRPLKKLIRFCRNASAVQICMRVPYSLSASCALVFLVVLLQTFLQKGSPYSTLLLNISGMGLISAMVLGLALTLGSRWLPPVPRSPGFETPGAKAYLLAIQLG